MTEINRFLMTPFKFQLIFMKKGHAVELTSNAPQSSFNIG